MIKEEETNKRIQEDLEKTFMKEENEFEKENMKFETEMQRERARVLRNLLRYFGDNK